jgi:hypothetical protein
MGDLDFDAIEAGVQVVAGAGGKAGDDGSDVVVIKRLGSSWSISGFR